MAKAKSKARPSLQEKCPKCQSTDFAIDKDIRANRHCSKCRNVWAAMSVDEIKMHQYKSKYAKALDFAKEVNGQLGSLLSEIELLGDDIDLDKAADLLKRLDKQSEIICSGALNM